MTTKMCELC